jgi:RNA recognition motif-containing protein
MESTQAPPQVPVAEPSSVIVRNIAPSIEPPTHKVLTDFFSFCGTISALSIAVDDHDASGKSLMAVVTFENKAASRTAILLNNALINERSISVEIAPPGFTFSADASLPIHSVPASELPPQQLEDNSASRVVVSLLAKGYILSNDAASTARQIDEDYAISKRASDLASSAAEGIRNVDAQLGVSATLKTWGDSLQNKAVSVSEEYHLNDKTQMASQALGSFGRSVGQGLQGVASSTAGYVAETPVLRDATTTISGWGTAIADVFRDAKTMADQQSPSAPPAPHHVGTPEVRPKQ